MENSCDLPRIIACGPDTVYYTLYPTDAHFQPVRCELPEDLQEELDLLKEQAQEQEEPVLTRFVFEGANLFMQEKGGSGGFKWILKNEKLTLALSRGKRTGIWGQARLSSEYLWGYVDDLSLAESNVQLFLFSILGERLKLVPSGCDLAVDVVNLDITSLNVKEHFVYRAVLTDDIPAGLPEDGMVDGPEAIKRRWGQIAGLPFGARNASVSALIYNKTDEIKYHSREKTWFHDLWKSDRHMTAWDGTSPVTRIELRFRRAALHEFSLDHEYDLVVHLHDLWAYGVGHLEGGPDGLPDGWLRYVVPSEDTNRSRWPIHPAWRVLQGAFATALREAVGDDIEKLPAVEEISQEQVQAMAVRDTSARGALLVPEPEPLDLKPFIRQRKREVNMQRAIASIAGYMSTVEAWRPLPGPDGKLEIPDVEPDLSDTFHFVYREVTAYQEEKERDFNEQVVKKRVLYHREACAA
ncbi:MAG: hypothetical protein ABI324_29845 [Ktedonobacteraceae bacterium]